MKYIIFGAGKTGEIAYSFFGSTRIECFIDNHKAGQYFLNKKILSLDDVEDYLNNYIIIVASKKYYSEMVKQLQIKKIKNFFIYIEDVQWKINSVLPHYCVYGKWHRMYYDEIFANYDISKYKNIIIYGINEYISYLLAEIGYQNDLKSVVAIIDENSTEVEIMGIPIKNNLNELIDIEQIECLIVNKKRIESSIRDKFFIQNKFVILDIYEIDQFIKCFQHPELAKFKDIYKGKRVFIIGNGPSLKIEDLEILYKNKEVCIGANMIYKIYDKTKWRADYLVMTDGRIIEDCWDDIDGIEETVILADTYHYASNKKKENIKNYIHLKVEKYYPNFPGFSEDITKFVYLGQTIVYDISLQMAAYMGALDIYLLGIDNNFTHNPTEGKSHFIKDYFKNKELFVEVPQELGDERNLSYSKAEEYSREHSFRIYNATRGGKLEVFERVNFDDLFHK